jgi:hypothetical protein
VGFTFDLIHQKISIFITIIFSSLTRIIQEKVTKNDDDYLKVTDYQLINIGLKAKKKVGKISN